MKKVLSLILAIVLVAGLLVPAYAAEVTTVTLTPKKEGTEVTELAVGDQFTVDATLSGNTGFAAMTIGLVWNEDVVTFKGFSTTFNEDDEVDELTGTILGQSVGINQNKGIVTNARTNDSKKNGLIFTANFEVIGAGTTGIGLIEDKENISCFQMKTATGVELETQIIDEPVNLTIPGQVTKYAIKFGEIVNGTVAAKVGETEVTEAAVGEKVTLIPTPADGYKLSKLTVMSGETSVEVTNSTFTMPGGDVTVSATFVEIPKGYTFATSADVTADNGGTAVVHVKVTGHSDENVTSYNAYDVTLTFDSDKLEYQGYDGAVKSDSGSVTVEGNTIRIVGCGAAKGFGTEIAALTFKTKAEGAANVTISKVQVSDKEESVKEDAPKANAVHAKDDTAADETPDISVVIVPFTVSKPGFVSGNDKVVAGENYTFSYTDTTNYTYSDLTVTVGGDPVTPTEENGVYTITNVTGIVEITATQTPNSYDVEKPDNVTGPDQATYGTAYVFTVKADAGMEIKSVKAAIGGENVDVTLNDEGAYVIEGADISGPITITVEQQEIVIPETKYTNLSFSGIKADEIEGGMLTQKVEANKDFTFKLNTVEGVTYTVKIGDEVLTANEDGSYTISAAKMIEGDLTVTIEKAEIINVEVAEYIKLDGQSMYLVTAKSAATDSVLKYGEETMYRSSKYTVTGQTQGAYCWLLISAENVEAVQDAAEAAIKIAETGVTATEVAYNYDVNGTTKVDVNDAQLAYDMYKAAYAEFKENLTMQKFLEADVANDGKLDVSDVAAIIDYIIKN